MEFEYVLIALGIIVAVILLYYGFTQFIKRKNLSQTNVSTIDIEKLIKALGNKENIVDVRSTPSKLTVTIVNHEIVDVESIKNLGASGIVEGKDTISMIFGKQSPYIEEDLRNIL